MSAELFGDVVGLRPEIGEAFRRLIDGWSQPGSSWSGSERLAMVSAVKAARSAPDLPPWESPRTVGGLIDLAVPLDEVAIDTVWRVTNHPGTLTHGWYKQTIESGLDPVAYVELVGVVSMANALEHFCAAVGVDVPSLPEPSNAAPETDAVGAAAASHWVPTVQSDLPNVRKALSAAPGELELQAVLLDALYVPGGALAVPLDQKVWSLERTQLELVASRVSTLNECFY